MYKTCFLLLLLSFSVPRIFSQCLTPPAPPACTSTEAALGDNETLDTGITKWYYGAAVTMNSLTINGGTLVVCTELVIDKFYMTGGTIYIRPGAKLVISSGIGSGLILNGNSYIYNYGTCEIQRNLSLDNGATASSPNVVINATSSSVFKMPNQYFVINNPHSWFVNNGSAEFWGIITDAQSSAGSVCLGSNSTTRMAVLINKIADTYRVSSGSACVNVYQFSQFNNKLTNDPALFVCLGSGHNSYSGCGGCPANNWGAAQVIIACAGCSAIAVLATEFTSFSAGRTENGYNKLEWQINTAVPGGFYTIKRSANGSDFVTIDSMAGNSYTTSFYSIDKNPEHGNNFYMISYIDPATGRAISSRTVKIYSENINGMSVFPTPFKTTFTIKNIPEIQQVILTDMMGRNILIRCSVHPASATAVVNVLQQIPTGMYIVHIRTDKHVIAQTMLKE